MIDKITEQFGIIINEICQSGGRDYTFVLLVQDTDPSNEGKNCRSIGNLDLQDEINLIESFLEHRKGQRQ